MKIILEVIVIILWVVSMGVLVKELDNQKTIMGDLKEDNYDLKYELSQCRQKNNI